MENFCQGLNESGSTSTWLSALETSVAWSIGIQQTEPLFMRKLDWFYANDFQFLLAQMIIICFTNYSTVLGQIFNHLKSFGADRATLTFEISFEGLI